MSEKPWVVFPAIDLRNGRVVRLRRGDPAQETVFAEDPAAVARGFRACGATWIHVVNLDGALGLECVANWRALGTILQSGLRVQFGGGVRDRSTILDLAEQGVDRIVLGTVAVEQPEILAWAVEAIGAERIAVAIDVLEGWVHTQGWRKAAGCRGEELARRCAEAGVRWLICTDIARDGTGAGLDVTAAVRIAQDPRLRVVAGGGVASLEDVARARAAGLAGVIVGRALYDGRIDLRKALAVGG